MAIRILWDKYETALLIDTYLNIADGRVDRKVGISELSKVLRKRAIDAGKEIDDIYRNENGIAMQLGKIEYLMHKKPDAQKHNTKIFIDMVNMYTTDQDQFNRILDEAKGVQLMESRQDKFFAWLSKEVPSFRMSDYFFVIGELESFAHKKHLFSGSLFDVVDPIITGRIVTAVNSDKIFRFTHKKQMKSITDLAQYFHNYTKAQTVASKAAQEEHNHTKLSESERATQPQTLDVLAEGLSSSLDHIYSAETMTEGNASLSGAEGAPKGDSKEEETFEKPEKVVEASRLDEEIKPSKPETGYTVDFANRSDYAFTRPIYVSYFGDCFYESSWRNVYVRVCRLLLEDYPDEFEYLRDSNGGGSIVYRLIHTENSSALLHTPVKIGDNYYVETNRSASDLMRYIKYLLDYCGVDYENHVIAYVKSAEKKENGASFETSQASVPESREADISKDPVIIYLEQSGVKYIDYRHKSGCLWIIGGKDIADKMEILQKNGV